MLAAILRHSVFIATGFPFLHALFFFWIVSARLVAGAVRTIAIDDTYGDAITGAMPVYSPDGVWSQGQSCLLSGCPLVNPDPRLVENGTWHDSVGSTDGAPPRTIKLTFEGHSINVFCIISEVDRVEIAVSNMTFEIDGVEGKPFYHDVTGEMDQAGDYKITYNFSVYTDTFPQGNHTLRISSVGYSRMLFDYALYTTDSDLASTTTNTSSATSNTGSPSQSHQAPRLAVIIGIAVGGSIALVAISVIAYLIVRRHSRNRNPHVHPIDSQSRRDILVYGKDNLDKRSYMSSSESVALEPPHPETPFFPYRDATHLHSQTSILPPAPREDREEEQTTNMGPSPSDSIPLMDFPAPPSGLAAARDASGSRLVLSGEETRLVGPDNSMARFARQKAAEREAELTRRMREMEATIASRKYATPAASSAAVALSPISMSLSQPRLSDTGRSAGGSQSFEMALKGQVEELRTEIGRMRVVQQEMALELRDATEAPPQYQ